MDSTEPGALARLRWLARLTVAYAVALVIGLQSYGIVRGVATGAIVDPWLAILPVLWFDVGLLALFAFLWGLSFGRSSTATSGWRGWFVPDFLVLRRALRAPRARVGIATAAIAYASLMAILTGLLVIDPAGTAPAGPGGYPFLEVFDAPLGWGPRVVWAPNPFVAVLVRPYTVAVIAALAVLAGFGIGLLRRASRVPQARAASGAAAGLLVMCPACAVSPTFAFFAGAITPVATAEGTRVAGLAIGPVMAFSTAMLLAAILLLWMGISRTSRILSVAQTPDGPPAIADRRSRLAAWALAGALVFALAALLVDLSAASPDAPHGGHGVPGEVVARVVVHPPAAVGLGFLGTAFAATGLWSSVPTLPPRRRNALVAGLAFLYGDGLVHWFAIQEHLGVPGQAWFFLITGAVQLAAVPLSIRRERVLWWAGVALTGVLITLFVATRFVPPPFALEPEAIEPLGLLSKALEVGILGALAVVFGRRIVPWKSRVPASHPS